MRKLLATLALALVALTTVEAQQQVVMEEGEILNLYQTDYVEKYIRSVGRVIESFYGDVSIGVSSDRSMVWVIFGEKDFYFLETFFGEDRGSYYILKVRKMDTYKDDVLSKSEYVKSYVIVYKYINRVELTDDFEEFLIFRGL